MSTQITTAFSQQFATNIQMLSQQKGSLLRSAVREESVVGEKAFFDQVETLVYAVELLAVLEAISWCFALLRDVIFFQGQICINRLVT